MSDVCAICKASSTGAVGPAPCCAACQQSLVGTKRVGAGLDDVRNKFGLSQMLHVTPGFVRDLFGPVFVAGGSHGLVFRATRPERDRYAIKLTFGSAKQVARELDIALMLTRLYVDEGDPFHTSLPIVKVYDALADQWTRLQVESAIGMTGWAHDVRQQLAVTLNDYADNVPTGIALMELASGTSLRQWLTDSGSLPAGEFETAMRDILLQVLLILSDLQYMLRLVHYGLRANKVLVQVHDAPQVYHYVLDSKTVYNVRTRYGVRLTGFGHAYLHWESSPYSDPDSPSYRYWANPDSSSYRYWADLNTLALSIVSALPTARINTLPTSTFMGRLLRAMLNATPANANLDVVRDALKQARSLENKVVDATAVVKAAADASQIVFEPAERATPPSPHSILVANKALFGTHAAYAPIDGDTVVDMSLQVGSHSSSVRTAAVAPESGGWLSGLFTNTVQ